MRHPLALASSMQPNTVSSLIPVVIGAVVLLVAAFFQTTKWRVPNWFLLVALIGAFAFAALSNGLNSCISAFIGLIAGGLLLLPAYTKCFLGAGCVKANAVFGAWVACGLGAGQSIFALLVATLVAAGCLLISYWVARIKTPDLAEINAQIPLSIGSIVGMVGWLVILDDETQRRRGRREH